MRYETLEELPFHCQINLPPEAQQVYREAWNRAWDESFDTLTARTRAWNEVRQTFQRDERTGRWVPRHGVAYASDGATLPGDRSR